MINEQLIDYIKQQLEKGLSDEIIYNRLLQKGWQYRDVKDGFDQVRLLNKKYVVQNITYDDKTYPELVGKKNKKSRGFMWFVVIIIMVAGALVYYYRDELQIVPFIKFLISENQIIERENLAASVNNDFSTMDEENKVSANSLADLRFVEIPAEGIIDCERNLECFKEAANNCQKSKVIVSKNNESEPLGLGTVNMEMVYEIIGQDDENCLARMKVATYELIYYPEIVASFLEQGKTKEEIDLKQKENSKIIIGAGQVCKAPVNLKFGNILNQDLISSNINEKNFMTVNNLNVYSSGLTCEQYNSISDKSYCSLNTGGMVELKLNKGISNLVNVFGYGGKEEEIFWQVKDGNIAEVFPLSGRTASISGLNIGLTEVVIKDKSFDPACSISLKIDVTDNPKIETNNQIKTPSF
jgi:hypothetical protein